MRAIAAFQTGFGGIGTAARFEPARGSIVGLGFLVARAPDRAQRLGRVAALGPCRGFRIGGGILRFEVALGSALLLARNMLAIDGFALAGMKILFFIDEDRRIEIRFRLCGQGIAELVFQNRRTNFLDRPFGQIIELERTERQPDQTVHLQAEMIEDLFDFAVLAFAQAQSQPDIVALFAFQFGFHRTVMHAVDGDAVAQRIEIGLCDFAIGAHTVTTQPAGIGQFDHPRQSAVIGQQQQAFGVDVETADSDHARQALRQGTEHGRTAFGIPSRGHQTARLVIEEQPCALALGQRIAVDQNDIALGHIQCRTGQYHAIDGDAAFLDPHFGIAARAQARTRHHFGNAVLEALTRGGATVFPLFAAGAAFAATAILKTRTCGGYALAARRARPERRTFATRCIGTITVGAWRTVAVRGPVTTRGERTVAIAARRAVAIGTVTGRTVSRRSCAEGTVAFGTGGSVAVRGSVTTRGERTFAIAAWRAIP